MLFYFQHGFRSSPSTADILTAASDRIIMAFHRSRPTRTVALDTSTVFKSVLDTGLLHNLKSYCTSGQVFGLISSLLSKDAFRWFWMESLQKNIHFMMEFIKAPFLFLHFSHYILMTFLILYVKMNRSVLEKRSYVKMNRSALEKRSSF